MQLELKRMLLKTNQAIKKTYGLNHISAFLELNPSLVVPILMISLLHLGWPLH